MLLMVEKDIRGEISHSIYQHSKANKKHMKDYDKHKEWSHLKYCAVNNLYDWAMSQKLPVNNFDWIEDTSQFNEVFDKNYNKESGEGYFVKFDVQYPEKLLEVHIDLPFLPERMKIEKVEKLGTNSHDKTEYIMHLTNLKQVLNHGLVLKNQFVELLNSNK